MLIDMIHAGKVLAEGRALGAKRSSPWSAPEPCGTLESVQQLQARH
jgi:hypothetical protein